MPKTQVKTVTVTDLNWHIALIFIFIFIALRHLFVVWCVFCFLSCFFLFPKQPESIIIVSTAGPISIKRTFCSGLTVPSFSRFRYSKLIKLIFFQEKVKLFFYIIALFPRLKKDIIFLISVVNRLNLNPQIFQIVLFKGVTLSKND